MNCFKSLILAPVFRSCTEVRTDGCAHSQRCSWPRMGWSLVSERRKLPYISGKRSGENSAPGLIVCILWNTHRPSLNTWIFLGKYLCFFFFSPQVGLNFTAGSEIKPELCFQKHVISTNRIIQKHIIIIHTRSPALRIWHFPRLLCTLRVPVYQTSCA